MKILKRKNIAIIYLLILCVGTILSLYIPKNEATANAAMVIPNDAIRLRILANSDSAKDQEIKRLVRDEVNAEITRWVSNLASKEEAKRVIQEGLPELQQIAERVVTEQNLDQSVEVEFGKVEFPTKLYGQFLYPAGEYEAILITLGKGVGANWWCVLFPPLCFLDFSNGVAVSEGFDEAEAQEPREAQESEEAQEPQEEQESEEAQEPQEEQESEEAQEPQEEQESEEAQEPQEEQGSEQESEEVQERREAQELQESPVYTSEDEGPVEVKFFVVELFNNIF